MSNVAGGTKVYGVISCNLNKRELAEAYAEHGWLAKRRTWLDYEVLNEYADLIIAGDSEILMHGPVVDLQQNIQHITEPLKKKNARFSFEWYDIDGQTRLSCSSEDVSC